MELSLNIRELVLDAWPIMDWFRGRSSAARRFTDFILEASTGELRLYLSRMNLGEIYYLAAKDFGDDKAEALVEQLQLMFIEVVTVKDADIDAAARLKGRYAISYADAFAAVLSIERNAPLITGDDDFKHFERDGLIYLEWVGL